MAIIIGYQAISAHDIKADLKELQEENRTLREQVSDNQQTLRQQQETFENTIRQEIAIVNSKTDSLELHADKILASTQESVAILNALILENSHNNSEIDAFDAFEKMHEALFFGLNYESKNIDYIFYKLRQYGSNITPLTFGGTFSYSNGLAYSCIPKYAGRSLRSILDETILTSFQSTEKKIREHKMFSSISHDYSVLVEKLYKRLDIISTRPFPKDISEKEEKF